MWLALFYSSGSLPRAAGVAFLVFFNLFCCDRSVSVGCFSASFFLFLAAALSLLPQYFHPISSLLNCFSQTRNNVPVSCWVPLLKNNLFSFTHTAAQRSLIRPLSGSLMRHALLGCGRRFHLTFFIVDSLDVNVSVTDGIQESLWNCHLDQWSDARSHDQFQCI